MSLSLHSKGFTKVKLNLIGAASMGFLLVNSFVWSPITTPSPFTVSQALAASPEKRNVLAATSWPMSISSPTSTATMPIISNRHVELEGGFSYVLPVGWQVRDFPGLKYKAVFGPLTGNFAPNLIFVDEVYGGSLDNYVSESLGTMKALFLDLKVINREAFITAEGKSAVKVITQSTQHNLKLQQTFYFFDLGAKKLVATYTRLVNKGIENDVLCDVSMKTFYFETQSSQ